MIGTSPGRTLWPAVLSLLVVLAVATAGTAVAADGTAATIQNGEDEQDGDDDQDGEDGERSCADLVVAALRQIEGDDVEVERGTRDGDEAVRVGNVDVICKDEIRGAAGKTLPRSDGRTDVWIDEGAIDGDLGVMKMILFHELEHVRLVRAGNGRRFGYANPRTGVVLGDQLVDGRLDPPDRRWVRNVAPCHEAIAHVKSLKYAQSVEEEFPELTDSDHFWRSIDIMLDKAERCRRSGFANNPVWRGVFDNFRRELAEDVDVLVEKALMKAGRSSRVTGDEARAIFRIARWADPEFDQERFEEIYRQVALADVGEREGYLASVDDLPPQATGAIRGERVLVVVESDNVQSRTLARYGLAVDGDAVRLAEPPADPTMTVTVDEWTFGSVRNSVAPGYAVRRAIETGALDVTGRSPFVGIGYRVVRFVTPAPAVPARVTYAETPAPVRRNPRGVRYVATPRHGVVMLNDYLAPAGYSTRGTQRLVGYRPNQLSRIAGVYAESVQALRLGVM